MHTITLQVNDSMYEHFLYLVKNLNPKEIQMVEEKVSSNVTSLNEKFHKLFEETDITAFKSIDDPVAWQKAQRDEW